MRAAYVNNLELFKENPAAFELQALAGAITSRFFRWHVSGDILNREYLQMMVRIAEKCPATRFLTFTKKYRLVNEHLDKRGRLPDNLKIIFSAWPGFTMDNPHGLPVAHVIFKDGTTTAPADTFICGGNCADCRCRGVGCWQLKNGENISFYEH